LGGGSQVMELYAKPNKLESDALVPDGVGA
jgi:hypothetical protein